MIILRKEQIAAIEYPRFLIFINMLCKHAHENFQNIISDMSEDTLHKNILKTVEKAKMYGLTSQRDCCRFLNLVLVYGWDFDENQDYRWMLDILKDTELTNPSNRLSRLVDECIYRQEVAEQNDNLWKEFYTESGMFGV